MREPYRRCYPVKDEDARKRYGLEHTRCECCGIAWEVGRKRDGGVGASVHHIIRFGRSDEECNLLLLCARCHGLIHDDEIVVDGKRLPKITLGMTLWIKRERGPWNTERLTALYGQTLPDLEPSPYESEYQRRTK